MKKITALLLAFAMLLCLSACKKNPYEGLSDAELEKMVDSGELGTVTAFYSVDNVDKTDDEILVQFDAVFKDTPFYSEKGTVIQFFGDKVIYDAKGEVIDESEIIIGDMLTITYDCKTYGKDPVTIKAIKVVKG